MNLYDYGARHYDPALGRWFVVDQLAEKYNSSSPYSYVENDPMNFVDYYGMFKIRPEDQNEYKEFTNYVKNGIQELLSNPKIMQALMTVSGRGEQRIREHFEWDNGPLINFDKQLGDRGYAGFASGEGRIDLAKNLADDTKLGGKEGRRNLLFLVLTLLHEDAHELLGELLYEGNYNAYTEQLLSNEHETGVDFELRAFGYAPIGRAAFKSLLDELLIEEENKRQKNEATTIFFNNYSNLEPGEYVWDEKQKRWIKQD